MEPRVHDEIWLAQQWFLRSDGWEHAEIVITDESLVPEVGEGWTVTHYVRAPDPATKREGPPIGADPVMNQDSLFEESAAKPVESPVRGEIVVGDALSALRTFPEDTFQSCITSPPYWGLRDYGLEGQIGAEQKVEDYIAHLVAVFGEVKRCLRPDGTLWLNIGDSFTSGGRTWRPADKKLPARGMNYRPPTPEGLKPKDLIGVPWRLAFALQADGWYLRTDIVWHKPNGNPESVKDRPSRNHEFIFLLTKSQKYFYDHAAVREPGMNGHAKARRSVWSINTEAFREAHFATFPRALVTPCVLAGSSPGSTNLDPFFGSGTMGEVCLAHGRNFVGIELNPEYAEIARRRLGSAAVEIKQL